MHWIGLSDNSKLHTMLRRDVRSGVRFFERRKPRLRGGDWKRDPAWSAARSRRVERRGFAWKCRITHSKLAPVYAALRCAISQAGGHARARHLQKTQRKRSIQARPAPDSDNTQREAARLCLHLHRPLLFGSAPGKIQIEHKSEDKKTTEAHANLQMSGQRY